MSHTPGPWRIWEYDDHDWWICETIPQNRHSHFAKVTLLWGDEGKANARLIAAAPDLLQALKDRLHHDGCSCAACEPMQAAITKATGTIWVD